MHYLYKTIVLLTILNSCNCSPKGNRSETPSQNPIHDHTLPTYPKIKSVEEFMKEIDERNEKDRKDREEQRQQQEKAKITAALDRVAAIEKQIDSLPQSTANEQTLQTLLNDLYKEMKNYESFFSLSCTFPHISYQDKIVSDEEMIAKTPFVNRELGVKAKNSYIKALQKLQKEPKYENLKLSQIASLTDNYSSPANQQRIDAILQLPDIKDIGNWEIFELKKIVSDTNFEKISKIQNLKNLESRQIDRLGLYTTEERLEIAITNNYYNWEIKIGEAKFAELIKLKWMDCIMDREYDLHKNDGTGIFDRLTKDEIKDFVTKANLKNENDILLLFNGINGGLYPSTETIIEQIKNLT